MYGTGGVYLRNQIWWMHYPADGRTLRESTGVQWISAEDHGQRKAEKCLKQRLVEVQGRTFAGPSMDRTKVSELLEDLLVDYELNGKTLWWAKGIVGKYLLPHFQYAKAARIGTKEIQTYALARRKDGLKDSTINRHFALLRRAFRLGFIAEPPKVTRVPNIVEFDESKSVRQGFLENDGFLRIRANLPDNLKPVSTFAYFTGCRKTEILGLQWPQFDQESRMIRLLSGETKNKEPRMIPLVDEVYDSLMELKKQRDEFWPWSPWIFSRDGKQILNMYGAWRLACTAAGLKGTLLHDNRRTAIRNMKRAGVGEVVAMSISGHKTRDVFDRYNIVDEQDLKDAAKRLQLYVKKKSDGE